MVRTEKSQIDVKTVVMMTRMVNFEQSLKREMTIKERDMWIAGYLCRRLDQTMGNL